MCVYSGEINYKIKPKESDITLLILPPPSPLAIYLDETVLLIFIIFLPFQIFLTLSYTHEFGYPGRQPFRAQLTLSLHHAGAMTSLQHVYNPFELDRG